jgi:hypothetical protein
MAWKFRWRKWQWPFYVEKIVPAKIVYEQPAPAIFTKLFSVNKAFLPNARGRVPVDWANWTDVIDEYECRIVVWYFDPVGEQVTNSKGQRDPAYPLMFTLCAFVDLMSQYQFDLDWHDQAQYRHFLRQRIPEFNRRLPNPIAYTTYGGPRNGWRQQKLKDRAEVFYTGIRCGLLHHGDLASFCGMTALPPDAHGRRVLLKECQNAGQSIDGAHRYDLLVFDPYALKDRLLAIFRDYCNRLRANPASAESLVFKKKILHDYGIVVP